MSMNEDNFKKQFTLKIEPGKNDRTVLMIASTGKEDAAGDTLNMSNWIFTRFMKNPVFLYAHNIDKQKVPIGRVVSLKIVNDEMWIEVYFPKIEELTSYFDQPALIHDHAKFVDLVYSAYKCGLIKGVSVGFNGKYNVRKDDNNNWLGREFTEQTLIEISSVPVPCNEDALSKIGEIPDSIKNYLGGDNMEIKAGSRLSKESMATLQSIHKEMCDEHDRHKKVMKGCYEKLAAFINPPMDDNNGDNEGKEEEKAFLSLLENLTLNITKE